MNGDVTNKTSSRQGSIPMNVHDNEHVEININVYFEIEKKVK